MIQSHKKNFSAAQGFQGRLCPIKVTYRCF